LNLLEVELEEEEAREEFLEKDLAFNLRKSQLLKK
jgi:hypothetical protein